MTRTAAPRDLFVEMARILAGAAPTPPRMPPGRVVEMQSRSRCGLEEALAEILTADSDIRPSREDALMLQAKNR